MSGPGLSVLATLTLLFSALSGWAGEPPAFAVELSTKGIAARDLPAVQAFIDEAVTALPSIMKERIARKVTVRFSEKLDSTHEFLVPPCGLDEQQVEGAVLQIRGRVETGWYFPDSKVDEITLNAAMLPEIVRGSEGSRTYACGHRSMYRLAVATLVHELSHIYDFSDVQTPEVLRLRRDCELLELRNGNAPCMGELQAHPRVISRLPSFRSVMYWGDEKSRNRLRARSQDPYEFSKPEESLAVNLEYFLLDPEYACRRPAEFAYFRDHFGSDPFPGRSCALDMTVELNSEALGETTGKKANLDPSRVYQIHYLFASQGDQFMSRWGHAMFRIILCNPSRKEVGPQCMNDIADHVVVSFRANQGDWNIDAWKGLTGKYPSRLFLYPFYPAIVNEYTFDENRDLISLPLKLSADEQVRFVQRVVEISWMYQGRYYFFSNNCATEALHLLKSVIRDADFQDWYVLTPLGLYDDLAGWSYIDRQLIERREQAMKQGNFFHSMYSIFEDTFGKIRDAGPALVTFADLKEFRRSSTPDQRLAMYQALLDQPQAKAKALANRFLILETYLFRIARRDFMGRLGRLLDSPDEEEMALKLKRVMELQRFSNPLSSSSTGYGVPTEADLATAADVEIDRTYALEAKTLHTEVMKWAKWMMGARSAQLEEMARNREFFLNEARKSR